MLKQIAEVEMWLNLNEFELIHGEDANETRKNLQEKITQLRTQLVKSW